MKHMGEIRKATPAELSASKGNLSYRAVANNYRLRVLRLHEDV